jgi:pheromone shutdown-related protein TraB
MFTHNFITVLGTNHVSSKSVHLIQNQFETLQPDIICVELDKQRLQGMLSKEKPKLTLAVIPRIGLFGFLFLLVGRYIQKKFGKLARLEPGADMLCAVELARQHKKQLALIDRPIEQTLRQMSTQFTWKEKRRLVYDVTLGLIFGKKQKITFSIDDVPEADILQQLLVAVRTRYPTFYDVLLAQRNTYMAKHLVALQQKFPEKTILAIVGAAHEPGIQEEIMKLLTTKKESQNQVQRK